MRRRHTLLLLIVALSSPALRAADAQGGKLAAQKCVQCHEADDWEGEDAPSLESLITDIAAGKIKHKTKIDLTSAEIANIAAYWGSGGKTQ
jgi:cytochrome c553